MAARGHDAAASSSAEEEVIVVVEAPTNETPTNVAPRAASTRMRRISGRPFAIGFGLFLVIGTIVFTYLARQAQISRESAFDRMQEEGVVPSGR